MTMQKAFSKIFTPKLENLKTMGNFPRRSTSKSGSGIDPMFPSIVLRSPRGSLGCSSTLRLLQRSLTFSATLLSFFSVVYTTFAMMA